MITRTCAQVNPAAPERSSNVLPWETSQLLRATGVGCRQRHPMGGEESAEAVVAGQRIVRRRAEFSNQGAV